MRAIKIREMRRRGRKGGEMRRRGRTAACEGHGPKKSWKRAIPEYFHISPLWWVIKRKRGGQAQQNKAEWIKRIFNGKLNCRNLQLNCFHFFVQPQICLNEFFHFRHHHHHHHSCYYANNYINTNWSKKVYSIYHLNVSYIRLPLQWFKPTKALLLTALVLERATQSQLTFGLANWECLWSRRTRLRMVRLLLTF